MRIKLVPLLLLVNLILIVSGCSSDDDQADIDRISGLWLNISFIEADGELVSSDGCPISTLDFADDFRFIENFFGIDPDNGDCTVLTGSSKKWRLTNDSYELDQTKYFRTMKVTFNGDELSLEREYLGSPSIILTMNYVRTTREEIEEIVAN